MNDISKAYRLSINTRLIFDKCLLFFNDCLSIFDKLYEDV